MAAWITVIVAVLGLLKEIIAWLAGRGRMDKEKLTRDIRIYSSDLRSKRKSVKE